MNLYVWRSVDELTENYHPGGGCVAVAESLDRAIELISEATSGRSRLPYPDKVFPLSDNEQEAVFIMPDAGCC